MYLNCKNILIKVIKVKHLSIHDLNKVFFTVMCIGYPRTRQKVLCTQDKKIILKPRLFFATKQSVTLFGLQYKQNNLKFDFCLTQ